MKKGSGFWGGFSVCGTFLILWFSAVYSGRMQVVLGELFTFFSGGVGSISPGDTAILPFIGTLFAVVAIMFVSDIIGLLAIELTVGTPKGGHALDGKKDKGTVCGDGQKKQGALVNLAHFALVLWEELEARLLFLGIIAGAVWYVCPAAYAPVFYVLLLVGNGRWAYSHLTNYEDDNDRQIVRVLPQFLGGLFISYVFVKYGIIGSLFVHLLSNLLLFVGSKKQNVSNVDFFIAEFSLICAFVSFALMSKPLADLALWVAPHPTFVLPGWGFCDYLLASVFLSACLDSVFDILMYDRAEAGNKKGNLVVTILLLPVLILPLYAMVMAGYWVAGFIFASVAHRALFVAIALAMITVDASGSSAARSFVTMTFNNYLMLCLFWATGLIGAGLLIAVEVIIKIPKTILVRMDD